MSRRTARIDTRPSVSRDTVAGAIGAGGPSPDCAPPSTGHARTTRAISAPSAALRREWAQGKPANGTSAVPDAGLDHAGVAKCADRLGIPHVAAVPRLDPDPLLRRALGI